MTQFQSFAHPADEPPWTEEHFADVFREFRKDEAKARGPKVPELQSPTRRIMSLIRSQKTVKELAAAIDREETVVRDILYRLEKSGKAVRSGNRRGYLWSRK